MQTDQQFSTKVRKKIAGWYKTKEFEDSAVARIVKQRDEIVTLLQSVQKCNTKKLIRYLDYSGFFYRPSSANRHHNFPGGLAEHSIGTFQIVKEWNDMVPSKRMQSELFKRFIVGKPVSCDVLTEKMNYDDMVIASICHDLCKAKHYYIEGRKIRSHNSDPELRSSHGFLSVKRLKENGIDLGNQELLLSVQMHMRLYSKPRFNKEATDQVKGRGSMLAIAVWAADKLDASRHPAGHKH